MSGAVAAAPAVGASSAPVAPTNGATSATTEPAAGTTSAPKPPAAGETAQAKPPEQPWKAKRKLLIKGKEVEREYDDRRLQILEHTASEKAEFEQQRAEFQARLQKLNEDPDSLFQEAGFDVEAYLARRAERAEQLKRLSPEQQENLSLKEKLAKIEQNQKRQAEEAEAARVQAEERAFVEGNTKLYGETMRMAGLKPGAPGAASMLSNMATVRMMAHQRGEPDLTPQQLLAHTERFENNLFNDMLARKLGDEGWRGRNGDGLQTLARTTLAALAQAGNPEAVLSWLGRENALLVTKALHAKTRSSPVPIVQEPAPVAHQTQAPNGNSAPMKTEWDILDGLGG